MTPQVDTLFANDLRELKQSILKMGALVESMISRSMNALIKRDSNLAREVISEDSEVNELEVRIDDLCLKILEQHRPFAKDLRFAAVGMKISTDLERMGDLSVNICELVLELNMEDPLKPYIDLPLMAEKSQSMVHGSLQAFVDRDAHRAQSICKADDEVDELEVKIRQELIKIMEKRPDSINRGVCLINVARQLERIGDHATNVAEEVNFLVKGQDIRHGVMDD